MAEDANKTNTQTTGAQTQESGTDDGTVISTNTQDSGAGTQNTPTVEELMEQIATERARAEKAEADRDRFKASNDKLSKSEAELKRRERARMTTAEREEEARKEAEQQQRQEYENALSELNKMKAQQAYAGTLADEKTVDNIISAVADADHQSIALIIENEKKAAVKAARTTWMKQQPQPNSGSGYEAMSKEQIMAIQDRNKRWEAIARNPEAFR